MNAEKKPNLSLGAPPKGLKIKTGGSSTKLLLVIMLLQCIVIAVLFIKPSGNSITSGNPSTSGGISWDYKTLALALEDRALNAQAAWTWEQYIEHTPDLGERPQILYRIGKLYMQAGDFEKAAAALVQADLAAGDGSDLKAKTGPKMVECLRKLGLYGEVGRELSRRVEVGGNDPGRGAKIASFAGETLYQADLDHMIEHRVDQMMAVQGNAGDEQQRRAFLNQMKSPDMSRQIFQECIQTEL
ncbi:MAG: tetratricopeptide repeat protein, partial [Planctomycetota bacterium]